MNIYTILFIAVYITNIIPLVSLLFIEKKDVTVTLSWLMVLLFLPWIGFILYFFIGSTYKLKLFSKKCSLENIEKGYKEILQENIKDIENEAIVFNSIQMKLYNDIVELNAKSAESIYTQDNSAILLTDAKDQYEYMFEEIEKATESINVLYFIIKGKDEIGKKFISLLSKKAQEGVEIRLIYDILGYYKTSKKDFRELIRAGGMVYSFLPSKFKTILNANYRMHRKILVIDGVIAYTGGINIGDDYLGLDPVLRPWRDTAVRLVGSCVQVIQFCFLSDWAYLDKQVGENKKYKKVDDLYHMLMYFKKPSNYGNVGVQILASGPNTEYTLIKDSYVKMIYSAKNYLYIQTPYFIPDETLKNALRIAAHSGVDVRIMIPGIPDKQFVYDVTLSYIEELLKNGIRVYKHIGFIHSKTFVLDDFIASIGTANFDIRSFNLNYEINTMLYSETFAKECKSVFIKDIADCTELTLEDYKKRNLLQKIKECFWRLFTPIA